MGDRIIKSDMSSGVIACAGFICKNNKVKTIEEYLPYLANVFQKASKNSDE